MLVITRKPGQGVSIGDIRITITRIRDRSVRIGIEAPKDVEITRCELLEKLTTKEGK